LDAWGEFVVGQTLSSLRAQLGYLPFYTGIEIADSCEEGGEYDPNTKKILICLTPGVTPTVADQETIRHEFFHAIQHAYPNLALDWDDQDAQWFIEGTATATERSSYPLKRRLMEIQDSIPVTVTRHSISVPLTDYDDRYRAQDFWVYTALVRGQSAAYLQPIFEAGGTPDKIYSALSLGDAYWNWVKNQLFEKQEQDLDDEDDADDGFEYSKCVLEPSLADLTSSISHPTQSDITGTLQPLQSAVVPVLFEQAAPFVTVSAEAGKQNANLRYKVYDEEGLVGCADLPDQVRTLRIPAADAPAVRHVVLSNVSASEPLRFEVTVGGG
jgi:hypothetical protein